MAKQPVVQKTIPRAMPLLVGMTAGVLAALVVAVQLAAKDMSVGAAWSQLFGGGQVQFRIRLSVVGDCRRCDRGRWRYCGPARDDFRRRGTISGRCAGVIGTLILCGLAHVAHGAEAPHGVAAGTVMLANASAIVIAAVMGLFGGFFSPGRASKNCFT